MLLTITSKGLYEEMEKRIQIISYVLLYYKAYEDTIDCIKSIKALNKGDFKTNIVIVDNNSADGSYDHLKDALQNEEDIHFIHNSENLGFARGNNVGIQYAKDVLKADFIVAINTDTLILQSDFNKLILLKYEKEPFYIMGPKVIGYYDGELQSPIGRSDDNRIERDIFNNYIHLLAWKTNLIKVIRKLRKPKNRIAAGAYINDEYNCVCSGCCIIFSPLFLDRWDGFFNGTFLYREERILFYVLNKLKCKTIYFDDIEIYHKGGSSSAIEYKNNARNKAIAFHKNREKSLKIERKIKCLSYDKLENVLKASFDLKNI